MELAVDKTDIPTNVIDALVAGHTMPERASAWVRWVWGELARGGLVPPSLNPRRLRYADHVIVLATLCRCVDRFAEVEQTSYESVEYAELTDLPRGWELDHSQLLEATEIDMHPDEEENNTAGLSGFVISEQEQALVQTVAEVLGVDVLFATLWAVGHGAPTNQVNEDEFGDQLPEMLQFPLDTYQLDGILEFDTTLDKLRMLEWVQEWSGVRY